MRKLRELEDMLLRVESAAAVVLVLLMLTLAAYNVLYRNVLVPLQTHWAHSGPPVEPEPEPTATEPPAKVDAKTDPAKPEAKSDTKAPAEGGADDFGGFGGGLGDEDAEAEPAEPEPEKAGGDDFGGFGGGFSDEQPEEIPVGAPGTPKAEADAPPAEPAKAEPAKTEPAKAEPTKAEPANDDFGGFGGGFSDEEEAEAEPPPEKPPADGDDFGGFGGGIDAKEPAEGGGDDFGGFGGGVGDKADAKDSADLEDEDDLGDDFGADDDQFANLPDIDAVGQKDKKNAEGPQGGPPPPGSFAAWGVEFIDTIKLDWIDIFLRQLVIIVSFLGGMLATQRRKHINIDALSKVLPKGAQRVVAVLMPTFAVLICLILASAGWDLVQISREYPNELLPFAKEWHMQLMFPVGFGLLAVHFAVRAIEAALGGPPPEEEAPTVSDVDSDSDPDAEADPDSARVRPSDIVTKVDEEDEALAQLEAELKARGDARTIAARPRVKKREVLSTSGELGASPNAEDDAAGDEASSEPTSGDDDDVRTAARSDDDAGDEGSSEADASDDADTGSEASDDEDAGGQD